MRARVRIGGVEGTGEGKRKGWGVRVASFKSLSTHTRSYHLYALPHPDPHIQPHSSPILYFSHISTLNLILAQCG